MLANKLMSALSGGAVDKLYVDDVFSTYLYTGSGTTQTINNGIDLAGEGGLVWIRSRNYSGNQHILVDTVRGVGETLASNLTDATISYANAVSGISSTGFSIGSNANVNRVNINFASWTFRKAPKFFDVVTATSNGAGLVTFNHSLGTNPGLCVYKRLDGVEDWVVRHRSLASNEYIFLNRVDAKSVNGAGLFTESATSVSYTGVANATYVAYLFAHDDSEDGIVQCGSFTTDAGGNATVNLGWEPQYVLRKHSNGTLDWQIQDSLRGMPIPVTLGGASGNALYPNTSAAESTINTIQPTSTGFEVKGFSTGTTMIYLAIRRPNKPPTTGTEVYNAVTRMGTSSVPWKASGAGFPPDMSIMSGRDSTAIAALTSYQHSVIDRLRRAKEHIQTINTGGEGGGWGEGHIHNMDGYAGSYSADYAYFNTNSASYVDFHFRRAPGFFDVVCYTGTGAARTVPHSLGVAPELMIVKSRSVVEGWYVYHAALGSGGVVQLNNNGSAYTGQLFWNSTQPTASAFSVGGITGVGNNGATFVWYGFASLPGISKVGSYTGNGTTQTINCGFTTGARFILIKRTDAAGDWYIWDTARGIVSANDPHLSLNTNAAEVTTDDSVDPDVSGFMVNQLAATNINVSGGKYIFLSIA